TRGGGGGRPDFPSPAAPDADPDAALPHRHLDETGNGISALDLASDPDQEVNEEDEAERQERDVVVGEVAGWAFLEYEHCRRATLPRGPPRIVDVMRGVKAAATPARRSRVEEDAVPASPGLDPLAHGFPLPPSVLSRRRSCEEKRRPVSGGGHGAASPSRHRGGQDEDSGGGAVGGGR
ncbi:unnamed protein product, partial [Urochloa humidicola]